MAERKSNGQFAKGNQAAKGYGRPPRAVEASYLVAMSEVVTPDDWKRICEKARDQALEGDEKARAWLSEYLLGSVPPKRSRPTLLQAHLGAEDVEGDIDDEKQRRDFHKSIAMY